MLKNIFGIAVLLLAFAVAASAQSLAKSEPEIGADITGMYSFLHEGEFVQIEVNGSRVTGLISHFKDEDPDKAEFVDQYFEEAKLEGSSLSFRTKKTDALWFEFSGTVERGPAKTESDEGYWVVRGILTEHRTGKDGNTTEKKHTLNLTSFPQDAETGASGWQRSVTQSASGWQRSVTQSASGWQRSVTQSASGWQRSVTQSASGWQRSVTQSASGWQRSVTQSASGWQRSVTQSATR